MGGLKLYVNTVFRQPHRGRNLLCRGEPSGSSGQTASPDSSLDIINAASSFLDGAGGPTYWQRDQLHVDFRPRTVCPGSDEELRSSTGWVCGTIAVRRSGVWK